jgi:hypothetical protein
MQFIFGIACVVLGLFTLTFQIYNSRRIDFLIKKLKSYEKERTKKIKAESKDGNETASAT